MNCPVCEYEDEKLETTKICANCGSTVATPGKYKYIKPVALPHEQAKYHFDALRNPVKVGIVQISTPLRKSNILDIEDQLTNAVDHITKNLVAYTASKELKGTYDFVYVGEYLQRLENPKQFLKQLRDHLKPKGVVEFFVPNPISNKTKKSQYKFLFAIPAFDSMLMLCGYRGIERTVIETEQGLIVCAQ